MFAISTFISFLSLFHLAIVCWGLSTSTSSRASSSLSDLHVAVIGGGPSGLLAAHRLLDAGAKVSLYEGRSDPRLSVIDDDRAYALGVGIRGRTALKTVDDELWNSVKSCGFPCDKFMLHPNPSLALTLRDDKKSIGGNEEPSMLLFQSDLCSVLLDELDRRHGESNNLRLFFDSKVDTVHMVSSNESTNNSDEHLYDLAIGCDGFRSKVRDSMVSYAPNVIKPLLKEIPGVAKVITVPMPSSDKLENDSVHLMFPKGAGAGTLTAFIEPTTRGACILFAGRVRDDSDSLQLLSPSLDLSDNATKRSELANAVREAFPLLTDQLKDEVIEKVARQQGFVSAAAKSNIYHCGLLALCGDAAHATGGVSGQGCNSALMDASVLVDCLENEFFDNNNNNNNKSQVDKIQSALLRYSQRQVPEGTALFELSIGSDGGVTPARRILSSISAVFDFVFKSGSTLQRTLGTN